MDVRFVLSVKFKKNWNKFQFWGQISQIFNFRSGPLIQFQLIHKTHRKHLRFILSAKFHKNQAHCNFETNSAQIFNFGSRSAILNIIFMINELDLLWVPNFMALGIYFISGTKYSWNKGIDTCFNVDCILLGRNFDFLGGHLVATARNLLITADYCLLPGGYWWLLLVTGGYCWLPLVPTFSMNA